MRTGPAGVRIGRVGVRTSRAGLRIRRAGIRIFRMGYVFGATGVASAAPETALGVPASALVRRRHPRRGGVGIWAGGEVICHVGARVGSAGGGLSSGGVSIGGAGVRMRPAESRSGAPDSADEESPFALGRPAGGISWPSALVPGKRSPIHRRRPRWSCPPAVGSGPPSNRSARLSIPGPGSARRPAGLPEAPAPARCPTAS